MRILCVGISHRTAGVDLRQRLAMDEAAATAALARWRLEFPEAELAILSTCNRTEIYTARPAHGEPRPEQLIQQLAKAGAMDESTLESASYCHDNLKAVEHLFNVTAGLDSMVLGEEQILGQVRKAYEIAQRCSTAGRVMHRIFQAALATARRVRSATDLGSEGRSVGSIAVEFAAGLFHTFQDKTLLVLGAGKMADLVLKKFLELKPGRLLVCNRTPAKAQELAARYGGQGVSFEGLPDHLAAADVVISSTGSKEPIVTARMFHDLLPLRRFKPIYIMDIALPRDFAPGVGQLPNVYLYDMDDLQRALAQESASRNGALGKATTMIQAAAMATTSTLLNAEVADLIRHLRRRLHDLGESEMRRSVNKLGSCSTPQEARQVLQEHTRRLLNKVLHPPLKALGRSAQERAAVEASVLRRLFGLQGPETGDSPDPAPQGPGDSSEKT